MPSEYLRGNPISLIERFWEIDPVANSSVPANPSTVTFTLLAPDGSEQQFVWPTDSEVTNPATGTFVLTLPPQLPPGEWKYRAEGAGSLVQAREDAFTIVESGVLTPVDSTVPTTGPCSSWINGDDVAAFDPSLGVGSDTWRLDDAAYAGSELMFELSGRQFPGVCQQTIRPCRNGCECWGDSIGVGPFYWTTAYVAGAMWWGWRSECNGDTCGCGNESYITLPGYPVREILEVKIDGTVLDASEYRLDQRRKLIRLANLTTTPPTDRFWPACQDLSLPDTEAGTYSVSYTWGADVPLLGRWAAAQMAAELWKAAPANQGDCKLPSRVTRVARQGLSMERLLPLADLLRAGQTGLQYVDAFIAQVNPTKARRRSAVWSPDVPRMGRVVGQ